MPENKVNDPDPRVDKYEELVNAILPILDEIGHLKKLIDEKTFKEITKKLEKYTIV
jgi:hypothetical protein